MSGYIGDFVAGSAVKKAFNTIDGGVLYTIAGSPTIAVYKGANTTQVTTGATLTVDFDSRTGHHLIEIDTSDAFYATGNDFRVEFTAGTVNGKALSGMLAFSFSIENRNTKANVVQISGDSTAADNLEAILDGTGGVGLTLSYILCINPSGVAASFIGTSGAVLLQSSGAGSDTIYIRNTASDNSGTAIQMDGGLYGVRVDVLHGSGVGVWIDAGITPDDPDAAAVYLTGHKGNPALCLQSDEHSAAIDFREGDAYVGPTIQGTVTFENYVNNMMDAGSLATDTITAVKVAADVGGEIADAVCDEALSGHSTAGTVGKALSDLDTNATTILARIGAFTGTGVNTIIGFLRAMANKAAGIATPSDLSSGGTFNNQTDSQEAIVDNAATDAEIADAVLDEVTSGHTGSGSVGEILTRQGRIFNNLGTAQAGAAGSITLASGASSTNDMYNGQTVLIYSGTGAGQARRISDYVGSTRVASVTENWGTTPDNTSVYMVIGSPAGDTTAAGLTAGQQAQLDAIEDATALITADNITISSPVTQNGMLITIVRGDTYSVAANQPLTWTAGAGVWADLAGATINFTMRNSAGTSVLTVAGTVTASGSGTQSVRVDLTSAQTATLTPGDPEGTQDHTFDVQATLSGGEKVTLARGAVCILADATT